METWQSKNSTKTSFVFGDEELKYFVQDASGSRSFTVPYSMISRDRQTLVERNEWLRNVGLIWMVIGIGLTALSLSSNTGFKISFWIYIGAICFGLYHFRVTPFTVVPTDKGNLYVIADHDGPRILAELDRRRAAYLRQEYDFLAQDDSPQQLRSRFMWLHREGALTDDELKERLDAVDFKDPSLIESVPSPRLLN